MTSIASQSISPLEQSLSLELADMLQDPCRFGRAMQPWIIPRQSVGRVASHLEMSTREVTRWRQKIVPIPWYVLGQILDVTGKVWPVQHLLEQVGYRLEPLTGAARTGGELLAMAEEIDDRATLLRRVMSKIERGETLDQEEAMQSLENIELLNTLTRQAKQAIIANTKEAPCDDGGEE